MKSSAPWSVKGVERDARETAKEAARREGMTVGEWLNHVISAAGEPLSTDGHIEGLKISDLVNAIEHMSRRQSELDAKASSAVDDVSRNLAGAVDRLQRLERIKPVAVADDPSLGERVARLEDKSGDRGRIDALKALEKAVCQVALQFDAAQKSSASRTESLERQIQQLASRLDGSVDRSGPAVGRLEAGLESLSSRLSRMEQAAEADAGDDEFVERTGARLRVLGEEIKRGGDQVRSLEGIVKRVSEQVDAAERRSSEGVQRVAETIAALKSHIAGAETQKTPDIEAAMADAARRTETRIVELQRSFETILTKLEQGSGRSRDSAALAAPGGTTDAPTPIPLQAVALQTAADSDDDFAPSSSVADDMFDLDSTEPTVGATPSEMEQDEAPEVPDLATSDDIDAILAELDGLGIGPERSIDPATLPVASAASTETTTSETLTAATPASSEEIAVPAPTFIQEARRAAKEAAEKAAAAEEQPRRKLTPKQRAILAAKVRRKRLAAEQGVVATASVAAAPATDAAEAPIAIKTEGKKSRSAIAAAILKARSFLPKPKAETTSETIIPDVLDAVGASRAQTKKLSRPVTLAFAAAIALAGAALVFLLKDVVFTDKERVANVPRPYEAGVEQAAIAPKPQLKDDQQPEVPAPPVVKPRALYLDAVARLKTATDERTTGEAIHGLEQAAALGHPPAQLQLGELYKLGQGVPQDPAQARAWYERSANGGNVLAMHRIGVMAARGQGGPVDQTAAVSWFEKAAGLGLVDSQYNLGAIYHPGGDGSAAGVQEVTKAYYWYALAAKNGDTQAGALAAGLAGGLAAAQRGELDAAVAAWKAKTPDPDANEIAPAS